jgi:hypothetical protein
MTVAATAPRGASTLNSINLRDAPRRIRCICARDRAAEARSCLPPASPAGRLVFAVACPVRSQGPLGRPVWFPSLPGHPIAVAERTQSAPL